LQGVVEVPQTVVAVVERVDIELQLELLEAVHLPRAY
jgi:hypothetical protein